jgi:hypothetical protein
MSATNVRRLHEAEAQGPAEVLEQLTITHADMMERFGPLFGMDGVEPPTGAKTFEAHQAALAAAQDTEANPQRRANLMLERTAREHEQIGRLASFIAGYELAHGDPANAPGIMELGGSHFDIAAQTRATLNERGGLAVNQNERPEDVSRFIAPEIAAKAEASQSTEPGRKGPGIEP